MQSKERMKGEEGFFYDEDEGWPPPFLHSPKVPSL